MTESLQTPKDNKYVREDQEGGDYDYDDDYEWDEEYDSEDWEDSDEDDEDYEYADEWDDNEDSDEADENEDYRYEDEYEWDEEDDGVDLEEEDEYYDTDEDLEEDDDEDNYDYYDDEYDEEQTENTADDRDIAVEKQETKLAENDGDHHTETGQSRQLQFPHRIYGGEGPSVSYYKDAASENRGSWGTSDLQTRDTEGDVNPQLKADQPGSMDSQDDARFGVIDATTDRVSEFIDSQRSENPNHVTAIPVWHSANGGETFHPSHQYPPYAGHEDRSLQEEHREINDPHADSPWWHYKLGGISSHPTTFDDDRTDTEAGRLAKERWASGTEDGIWDAPEAPSLYLDKPRDIAGGITLKQEGIDHKDMENTPEWGGNGNSDTGSAVDTLDKHVTDFPNSYKSPNVETKGTTSDSLHQTDTNRHSGISWGLPEGRSITEDGSHYAPGQGFPRVKRDTGVNDDGQGTYTKDADIRNIDRIRRSLLHRTFQDRRYQAISDSEDERPGSDSLEYEDQDVRHTHYPQDEEEWDYPEDLAKARMHHKHSLFENLDLESDEDDSDDEMLAFPHEKTLSHSSLNPSSRVMHHDPRRASIPERIQAQYPNSDEQSLKDSWNLRQNPEQRQYHNNKQQPPGGFLPEEPEERNAHKKKPNDKSKQQLKEEEEWNQPNELSFDAKRGKMLKDNWVNQIVTKAQQSAVRTPGEIWVTFSSSLCFQTVCCDSVCCN